MPDKILTRIRNRKMRAQGGLCYYCAGPMWIQDITGYCAKHSLSQQQAQLFKCTAEHLIARRDGGRNETSNIVAACLRCNQKRHEAEPALSAADFKRYSPDHAV